MALALTVPGMGRAGHQGEGNFRIKQSSMFGEVQYLGTGAFCLLIKQGSVIFDLKAAATQNPRWKIYYLHHNMPSFPQVTKEM